MLSSHSPYSPVSDRYRRCESPLFGRFSIFINVIDVIADIVLFCAVIVQPQAGQPITSNTFTFHKQIKDSTTLRFPYAGSKTKAFKTE